MSVGQPFPVLDPNAVQGVKVVAGQQVTVTASDTIVTGLRKVLAVIVSLDDSQALALSDATATIGDQAGTPAAGAILLKTWKATSAADGTPLAATAFGAKVNWIAFGY
jgi:hypothetical protein